MQLTRPPLACENTDTRRWWGWAWSWLAVGGLLAAGVVVAVSLLAGAPSYLQSGIRNPGTLVTLGVPLLRLAANLAATVCVGALGFTACCTRPQRSGLLSGPAYGEIRVAGWAAAAWCVAAAALVPFSAAVTAGVPLQTASTHLVTLLGVLEPPRAWLLTAGLALVVALGCRALTWRPAPLLLAVAVAGLLPPIVTGHGASSLGHDLATAALVIHVPAAALWLGALLALLRQARRGALALPEMFARYTRLGGWCWVVLVASGLVLGGVLAWPLRIGHGYVNLLLFKVALVAVLGLLGLALRRRARRHLDTHPGGAGRVLRLSAGELVLLLGAFGASVGLTRLPLPGFLDRVLSTPEILLGYDLAGPPTLLRLLTDWRFGVLFGSLALLLGVGYLLGVARLRRRGLPWPLGRTAAWLGGCLVLLVATSSGLGRYAAAMFSLHQASHMLIAMLVPALLVLGAPLTLLRHAGEPAGTGGLPGVVELAERLRDTPLLRALTHPVSSLLLFAGSPFVLYFTGLFNVLVQFHWGHMLIEAWFLAVGYLFFWPLIGVDRPPRPVPDLVRLGVLLAAMPADIVFGALVITTDRVIGNGPASSLFYQALDLPWVSSLLADQWLAGVLALVIGELTLLLALAVLLVRWHRAAEQDDDDGSGLGAYRRLGDEVGVR